jgi:hypothetical protein
MSKLNPQKASAYVGPGVLRKGGKITPVPNGPLIKKKGPFKGSTLKSGSTIKKAQDGVKATKDSTNQYTRRMLSDMDMSFRSSGDLKKIYDSKFNKDVEDLNRQKLKGKTGYDKNGFPVKKKMKAGGMIKRADGSMSKRGLWDNIRANKGSGKKPTKQMLVQEKKIKAKTKK